MNRRRARRSREVAAAAAVLALVAWGATAMPVAGLGPAAGGGEATGKEEGEGHASRLPDEAIPLQLEGFPERPGFLVELGNPYLGTGRIRPGLRLPTGAVWQPSLIVFGTLRSAVQSFESGPTRITEWANRLDLFANLQLSGTERLVVGFRNFDRDGRFSGYVFDPDPGEPAFAALYGDDDRFQDELNAEIQTLFFEGDVGEIFPELDRGDFRRFDLGFAVGRQPLSFQDGMLIDDSIDGVGLTRNTLQPAGVSNFRTTLFVGPGDVHRANFEDRSAELYALLTSTDLRRSTVDADLVYVTGDELTGDLVAVGVSAVQRIGLVNTTFRLLASQARDRETPFSTDGYLWFSEISWTPAHTHDLAYVNTFWALDEFSSAARGPASGGPLGRAGINFAAVGLGRYGAPLSSRARDVVGGAIGYQKFFGPRQRRQLLAELGVRVGTDRAVADEAGATLRHQRAFGRRFVLVVDGFVSYLDPVLGPGETRYGGRLEMVLKF